MASVPNTMGVNQELGYSPRDGVNWSDYITYRPIYPASFFNRIYNYHALKPLTSWVTAHDIGAGCGIVSSKLASRFESVIISDPNDGYTTLAQSLLIEKSGIPESHLRFLQEPAEKSSVGAGTVDVVTACQMLHWTDTDVAIQEFGRQLKPGGTLLVSYYGAPRIANNGRAQQLWEQIMYEFAKRPQTPLLDQAFRICNPAYQPVDFPDYDWEDVRRIYINTHGNTEQWMLSGDDRVGESRVREGEKKIWIDGDEDWIEYQGVDWLKGHLATFIPRIPESEIQNLWDELTQALEGGNAKIELPVVMILATRL